MRKLVVLSMMTLDGIIQAPGGPEEDTSGGFQYGGWIVPYADEFGGQTIRDQVSRPFDLLLGKRTYDIFAGYWPQRNQPGQVIGNAFNKATKYVASGRPFTPGWDNTVVLEGDAAEAVRKLKAGEGPDLQVHGSVHFVQTLLRHDLVDELWLKIYPLTLSSGKRFFAEGVIPAAFRLTDCKVSPAGVIYANYERAGAVKTGSFPG